MVAANVFPSVRIGEPTRTRSLQAFPLFASSDNQIDYLLSHAAMESSALLVEEIGEQGSVPNLQVENVSDTRVLFIEGEELVGAKQNRVLNTSILVAAHAKMLIPVSCVEQGRWRFTTRRFGSSGRSASSKLRHVLKSSVSRSLRENKGHTSDQGGVWKEVARQQTSLGIDSHTCAMSDTYAAFEQDLTTEREKLAPVPDAIGVAFAIGGKIVSVDVFDKPSTCQAVWSRLLSGLLMESLEETDESRQATTEDVAKFLAGATSADWTEAKAAGEGTEWRTEFAGNVASALVCSGVLVHGSVVAA